MIHKGRIVALLVILCLGVLGAAHAQSDKRALKVMTQNMDAGTDLGFLFVLPVPQAVDATYSEVTASKIPERAALLAEEIVAKQPDLISLQEVTLWRTGASPATAVNVLYDQLDLLLQALEARHQHYKSVAVVELTDAALPMSSGTFLRYTDRDAVLARSDLPHPQLALSNIQTHRFAASFNFLGIPIYSGWITVDANVRRYSLRFVTTHLQNTLPAFPPLLAIQIAQAAELIAAVATSEIPVLIAGDFNSNAAPTAGDNTPAVGLFLAAGFTDAWQARHPGDPGLTWPLFLEDVLSGTAIVPFERIDIIFERGVDVLNAERVGHTTPPFASDHLGVDAMVLLEP
jgi:endonuclease/exonuclease/phosphatase family metal-dependent hydrolase